MSAEKKADDAMGVIKYPSPCADLIAVKKEPKESEFNRKI
jgi:hypothetical protein